MWPVVQPDREHYEEEELKNSSFITTITGFFHLRQQYMNKCEWAKDCIAEFPIQWNGYQITPVAKYKLMTSPTQALGQASREFEFVTHKSIVDVPLSIRDTQEESLRPAPVRSWDCDEGYFSLVLFLNNAWLISQLWNRVKLSTEWKLRRESGGSCFLMQRPAYSRLHSHKHICHKYSLYSVLQTENLKLYMCLCFQIYIFNINMQCWHPDQSNLLCTTEAQSWMWTWYRYTVGDFLLPMRLFSYTNIAFVLCCSDLFLWLWIVNCISL